MNDDFLRRYRKHPDPEFAEALYHRISHTRWDVLTFTLRRVSWAVAAAAVLFAAALAASPAVRAATISVIRQIGSLRVQETSEYPGGNGQSIVVAGEDLSLAEAARRLGSPISLPAYVPEGYELQAQARLIPAGQQWPLPQLTFEWLKLEDHSRRCIQLVVSHQPEGSPPHTVIVGEGAAEEVEVRGRPATLVRGAWNADTHEYEYEGSLMLTWQYDEDTTYAVHAFLGAASAEELLAIAESIP